jgi:hypothetical protein
LQLIVSLMRLPMSVLYNAWGIESRVWDVLCAGF